ncbi:MAG: BACON domain-containing protein [Bacteroidales bacterium]|nr:BACON domain-containing protein [Bacteroidales bacterium]
MKNKNRTSLKRTALIILPLFLLSLFLLSSCKEEPLVEDPYFSIEGDPTGLTVDKASKTEVYVVRSNRPWQIVNKEGADWVKAFPDKGEDDGIFKIIVDANETFDPRISNFAFVVDGEEQPVLFRVEQAGNLPYITLPDAVSIPAAGGEFFVDVVSNVAWTYSLSDETWLSEVSVTSQKITFNAEENESIDPREVTLTVTATNYPTVVETVTLSQSPGTVVLEEDFSWLAYGSAVFYTTGGETRIDKWTPEQLDMGWTSTINTVDGSGSTAMLYARTGFVKLGKTSYGGDLISPALSKLEGTQTVTVTFKAIPYMTKAGTMDDNVLKVSVIGPGTVSQEQFIIDNWPVYPEDEGTHTDYCIGMWSAPEATRTFTITGATAETQIKFLGNDYDLRPTVVTINKNRIFLDDIKVEIVLP